MFFPPLVSGHVTVINVCGVLYRSVTRIVDSMISRKTVDEKRFIPPGDRKWKNDSGRFGPEVPNMMRVHGSDVD